MLSGSAIMLNHSALQMDKFPDWTCWTILSFSHTKIWGTGSDRQNKSRDVGISPNFAKSSRLVSAPFWCKWDRRKKPSGYFSLKHSKQWRNILKLPLTGIFLSKNESIHLWTMHNFRLFLFFLSIPQSQSHDRLHNQQQQTATFFFPEPKNNSLITCQLF